MGHTGTLDPFASGLLVVLVGRATRLAQFVVGLPKRYRGVIVLGVVTDTDDPTGVELQRSDAWRGLPEARIVTAMRALTGRYAQRPPAYSAKKRGGERAYRLARRGERAELPAQEVEVRRFALLERDGARLIVEVEVTSGTYIRALARDVGARLGCGAHLAELRRIAVGSFAVEDATPLAAFEHWPPPLRPSLDAVTHLPRIDLDEAAREHVAHGRPIAAPTGVTGPVALVAEGHLVAVARPEDGLLKPRVVLAA